MLFKPDSPKHTSATKKGSVYPYYAGYSEQFVESVLRKIGASNQDTILDPWNGSGTTTAVCTRLGIRSFGVDVNPAMKPIAAVRSMPFDKLHIACEHAISVAAANALGSEDVPLFKFCGQLLHQARHSSELELHDALRFGMMVSCRALARRLRSKNPTWFSLKLLSNMEISPKEIVAECISSFTAISTWKRNSAQSVSSALPHLTTADWSKLRGRRAASHVITSPPYLTRIDYVMKTLPELLLLNEEGKIDLDGLRKAMLGSVLTGALHHRVALPRSATARFVLEKIKNHQSKASNSYYFRFFLNYFMLERDESRLAHILPR